MHDHGAAGAERLPQRAPDLLHIVPVDHAHVCQVELLEEEPRRPERFQRFLQLRAEPLDLPPDAGREAGQPRLQHLAGLVAAGVQAQAVEVAGEGADVG